jgi:hypothetical protein
VTAFWAWAAAGGVVGAVAHPKTLLFVQQAEENEKHSCREKQHSGQTGIVTWYTWMARPYSRWRRRYRRYAPNRQPEMSTTPSATPVSVSRSVPWSDDVNGGGDGGGDGGGVPGGAGAG